MLFYINNSKGKDGIAPVLCRITTCGTVAQFGCKLDVPRNLWDSKAGRAVGRSRAATSANNVLDGIRARLSSIYHELLLHGKAFSATQIRDIYFGKPVQEGSLLVALDQQVKVMASRVGTDRAVTTLQKYKVVRRHVSEYLARCLRRKDISLQELDEGFLRDFCIYLRDCAGLSQSTVWVYQMPLRTIVSAAFNDGVLPRNPFSHYHVSPLVKEREFLSENELGRLIKHPFKPGGRLDFTRDLFVFCCFTGLSFIDLKNLTASDIVEFNGSRWIVSRRHKTKVHFQAKLLPVPLRLLEKYGFGKSSKDPDEPVFYVGSYSSTNKRLKAIGRQSGISCNLTFHMARHTFATLALSKGMSMESLSSILGHTDLHTTQIYAKITSRKLENDYSRLADGLGNVF